MANKISNIFLSIFLVILTGCGDTQTKCAFSGELIDADRENLRVMPVGAKCNDDCKSKCEETFSGNINPGINDDNINKCISSCRLGQTYTSTIIREKLDPNSTNVALEIIEKTQAETNSEACDQNRVYQNRYEATRSNEKNSVFDYFYPSSITLSNNEQMTIELDTSKMNALAMCGIESTWLIPNPFMFNQLNYCLQSSCANSASSSNTALLKNNTSNKNTWRANNYKVTDSLLNVRDGDLVTIEWYGPYMSNMGPISDNDQSILIRNPATSRWNVSNQNQMLHAPGCKLRQQTGNSNYYGNLENYSATSSSPIQFLGLSGSIATVDFNRDTQRNLNSRDKNTKEADKDLSEGKTPKVYSNSWKNLTNSTTTNGLGHYFEYEFNLVTSQTINLPPNLGGALSNITNSLPTQTTIQDIRFEKATRKLAFTGVLDGYSDKFSRLGFSHIEADGSFDCNSTTGPNKPIPTNRNSPSYFSWADNLGGHTVHVSRNGCVIGSGQRLIYAFTIKPDASDPNTTGDYIFPPDPPSTLTPNTNPNSTVWRQLFVTPAITGDNPSASVVPVTLDYPEEFRGSKKPVKVWFAIDVNPAGLNIDRNNNANNYNNPSDIPQRDPANQNSGGRNNSLAGTPYSIFPGIGYEDTGTQNPLPTSRASDLAKIQNRFGEYNIKIEKTPFKERFVNIISGPINDIYEHFFGSSTMEGIVPKVFNNYIINSNFNIAIRAFLVLYITITGLLFALGLSPITQQEAVTRSLKFAIVAMLLGPNSWEFFYNNFFALFTDGVIELISYLVRTIDQSSAYTNEIFMASSLQPANMVNRYNIGSAFSIFDQLLAIFLSSNTWIKLFGLTFSTYIGFILAFATLVAFCYAFVGIFRAVIIYLVSLNGIALLIMLTPFFLCFLLFKTTKTIFDGWLKQLMSFAIQPLIVIPAICLLGYLLIVALYATLNFTACSMCLLGLYVDLSIFSAAPIDKCFIKTYYTLSSLFFPANGFASPLMLVSPILSLLVLGQAIYVFSYLGANLAQQIIASFGGVNLADTAAEANPITQAASTGAKMAGLGIAGNNARSRS